MRTENQGVQGYRGIEVQIFETLTPLHPYTLTPSLKRVSPIKF